MFNWIKDAMGAVSGRLFGMGFQFDKTHKFYPELLDALANNDEEKFISMIDRGQFIEDWSAGAFKYSEGQLQYAGEPVHSCLQDHIEKMIKEKQDCKPLLRFIHRAYSKTEGLSDELRKLRIESLWRWVEENGFTLLTDGAFIAYKYVSVYEGEPFTDKLGKPVVNGDFVDSYSQCTYRYNVGDKVSMDISEVNTDQKICAGAGIHVGNYSYVNHSNNSLIVKVNPEDVVVVPQREACKIRTTGFEVLGVHQQKVTKSVVSYDDFEEDMDDDYCDYCYECDCVCEEE